MSKILIRKIICVQTFCVRFLHIHIIPLQCVSFSLFIILSPCKTHVFCILNFDSFITLTLEKFPFLQFCKLYMLYMHHMLYKQYYLFFQFIKV